MGNTLSIVPQELMPQEIGQQKQMENKIILLFSVLLALFAYYLGYSLVHMFNNMHCKGSSTMQWEKIQFGILRSGFKFWLGKLHSSSIKLGGWIELCLRWWTGWCGQGEHPVTTQQCQACSGLPNNCQEQSQVQESSVWPLNMYLIELMCKFCHNGLEVGFSAPHMVSLQ